MNDQYAQNDAPEVTGSEGVTDANAGETTGSYGEGTVTADAPEQPDAGAPVEPSPEPPADEGGAAAETPAPEPEPETPPAPEDPAAPEEATPEEYEQKAADAEAIDPDRAEQVRIQNTSMDPSTGSTMQAEGRPPLGVSPSE